MQSHRLAFCVCQAVCFACLSVLRGGIALASIIHSTLAPSTDLGKFLHISEGQCFAHEQPRSLRSAPRMHCHSAADAFADTDRMGTGGWLSTSDSFIWYVFPPGFCHSVSLSLSLSLSFLHALLSPQVHPSSRAVRAFSDRDCRMHLKKGNSSASPCRCFLSRASNASLTHCILPSNLCGKKESRSHCSAYFRVD